MIIEIHPEQYILVKPLLVGLKNHPVINGEIDGNNRGKKFGKKEIEILIREPQFV
jgi:hypothetical protein